MANSGQIQRPVVITWQATEAIEGITAMEQQFADLEASLVRMSSSGSTALTQLERDLSGVSSYLYDIIGQADAATAAIERMARAQNESGGGGGGYGGGYTKRYREDVYDEPAPREPDPAPRPAPAPVVDKEAWAAEQVRLYQEEQARNAQAYQDRMKSKYASQEMWAQASYTEPFGSLLSQPGRNFVDPTMPGDPLGQFGAGAQGSYTTPYGMRANSAASIEISSGGSSERMLEQLQEAELKRQGVIQTLITTTRTSVEETTGQLSQLDLDLARVQSAAGRLPLLPSLDEFPAQKNETWLAPSNRLPTLTKEQYAPFESEDVAAAKQMEDANRERLAVEQSWQQQRNYEGMFGQSETPSRTPWASGPQRDYSQYYTEIPASNFVDTQAIPPGYELSGLGQRRARAYLGENQYQDIAQNSPELSNSLDKQYASYKNLNEVMKDYRAGIISATEAEAASADVGDQMARAHEKGAQGFHNMWRESFILFGLSMGMRSFVQELETATGTKMPDFVHEFQNITQLASDFGMMGAMMGMGAGGIIAGAAVGVGVGLLGALTTVPQDEQQLNQSLDQLAQKDQTITTLALIMGWTKDQAEWALTAAKNNYEYADSLDKVARSREKPTVLQQALQAPTPGVNWWEQVNWGGILNPNDKSWNTKTIMDQAANQKAAQEQEFEQQQFNVQTMAPYQGLTASLGKGPTAQQGLAQLGGITQTQAGDWIKLAQADEQFNTVFEQSIQKALAYAGSVAQAQREGKNSAAAQQGLADSIKQVGAAADEAQARLDRLKIPSIQMTGLKPDALSSDISKADQLGDQYLAFLRAAGKDTSELEKSWKENPTVLADANGQLTQYSGKIAAMLPMAQQLNKAFQLPTFSFQNLTAPQLTQREGMAEQFGQAEISAIQAMNIPVQQQQSMIQQLRDTWSQTTSVIVDQQGQVHVLTGEMAALLGIADQYANSMQKAQNPTIQTMPELTPQRAGQLQQYLTQYENLLRAQGVQQTPQQYLMFGANGGEYKFTTSAEAMQLAMALLQDQIKQNTDELKESNKLRGHYNIPTDFGYQPPTPWEYYSKTGSTETGPVNYPWDHPGDQQKYYMGSVPTGAPETMTTTFGDTITSSMSSLNLSSIHLDSAASALQAFAAGSGYAYDAASGQLVKQLTTTGGFLDPLRGKGRETQAFGANPNDPRLGYGPSGHNGIDYGAPAGTPIYAAQAGTVAQVGTNGIYGNYIVIQNVNGAQELYGHMQAPSTLKAGQQVDLNTLLGLVGSTGNSTGNHLHFGYYPEGGALQGGKSADPAPLFNNTAAIQANTVALQNKTTTTGNPPASDPLTTSGLGEALQQTQRQENSIMQFLSSLAQRQPGMGDLQRFDAQTPTNGSPVGGGGDVWRGTAGSPLAVQGIDQSNASLSSIQSGTQVMSSQMPPIAAQQLSVTNVGNGLMLSMVGVLTMILAKVGTPPIVNVTVTPSGSATTTQSQSEIYRAASAGAGIASMGGNGSFIR